MKKGIHYYYLVEGQCESKLLNEFKNQKNMVISGKVLQLNVTQKHITQAFLRTIPVHSVFILIFDTDTSSTGILDENIRVLSENKQIDDVWCVTQVNNLEDELIRSTNVSDVKYLTGSKSNTEYKHDLIEEKRLYTKLMNHNFDFSKFWSSSPKGIFASYINQGDKIKINK